jgi:hypothetical protein
MKIVEIDNMGKGFVERSARLLGDHDGVTISTHEAFEEIEAIEAANGSRTYHTLILERDDLAWELRMNARA